MAGGTGMDPERRRQQVALGELYDRWQSKYQVDDAEWVPGSTTRRPPTFEAEREYVHAARQILGMDPETGFYLDQRQPILPRARGHDEVMVFLSRRACQHCGRRDGVAIETAWRGELADRDGTPIWRYHAPCPSCGQVRAYLFHPPTEVFPPGQDGRVVFGGPEPSGLV